MNMIRDFFENPTLTVWDIVREVIATAMLIGIVVGLSGMIMWAI